ncbi:MAG TPA: hypothetical protein VN903_08750 [Polyangia bacterium]|nr:hypothetical protein [Polyangia bacterium]
MLPLNPMSSGGCLDGAVTDGNLDRASRSSRWSRDFRRFGFCWISWKCVTSVGTPACSSLASSHSYELRWR